MAGITAPVSLSKIIAKFGGSGKLSDCRRGGGLVPDIPANAAILTTTSGLAVSQFLGADTAAGSIVLSAQYINDSAPSGSISNPQAQYTLQSDGIAWRSPVGFGQSTGAIPGQWCNGLVPSEYECLVTMQNGTLSVGSAAVGSWLALSTSRTWLVRWPNNYDGSVEASFLVQIRKIGTTTILASAVIELVASKGVAS